MALVLADRVQETTTTTGTGTVTLLGAVQGYQSFSAVGDANTTYYTIAGQGTSEWEVGLGTYTSSGTTLSRTTVLGSSNSGSLVSFSAGTKNVFVTYPATKAVWTDTPSTFGFKNRLINGLMQIAQRATSGTSGAAVPTTSPTYPSIDRWYAYATGATVTVARVAGSGSNQYNLQVTGAASVTAVGVGQRIEQSNSYDMAGSTATLSVNISNSLLTTVTWTANYATSADTWSAKTQIATGTFTVTSTLTNYTVNISIPAAATTGIEILFTVGAQTSGTWVIGNAQLEKGSAATTFDYRSNVTEFQLCQRYLQVFKGSDTANPASNAYTRIGYGPAQSATNGISQTKPFVPFRTIPSATTSGSFALYDGAAVATISAPTVEAASTPYSLVLAWTGATGLTITRAYELIINNSSATYLWLTSEL